eukprot:6189871-Pleurochrysis_carterae.AAC.1
MPRISGDLRLGQNVQQSARQSAQQGAQQSARQSAQQSVQQGARKGAQRSMLTKAVTIQSPTGRLNSSMLTADLLYVHASWMHIH